MRIRILSDLHIEFEPLRIEPVDADVVVVAGDVHPGQKSVDWIRQAFPEMPVVFVLGNHEYYRFATPKLLTELRAACNGTGIRLLENERVDIGGVRFLGATLWTDFALFGDSQAAGRHAASALNDYKLIRVDPDYRRLRGLDTARMHATSRRWIIQQLSEPFPGPTVVVTHHAPSSKSLPDSRQRELLSAAYASNMDELVDGGGASLWVHGHIHHPVDYKIGRTRIVSNPRGYPDERPCGFDPGKVVDLGMV